MAWEIDESAIPGCFRIFNKHASDERGSFVKVFQRSVFAEHTIGFDIREMFYTVSKRNVLRGLHFQLPPHDHMKAVLCQVGRIMDVVVDLRHGSPTYGQHVAFDLNANDPSIVIIPTGLAHGFFVQSDEALVAYAVSTEHASTHDSGIRWDSAGIAWPTDNPILSARDATFAPLDMFDSPFVFSRS